MLPKYLDGNIGLSNKNDGKDIAVCFLNLYFNGLLTKVNLDNA